MWTPLIVRMEFAPETWASSYATDTTAATNHPTTAYYCAGGKWCLAGRVASYKSSSRIVINCSPWLNDLFIYWHLLTTRGAPVTGGGNRGWELYFYDFSTHGVVCERIHSGQLAAAAPDVYVPLTPLILMRGTAWTLWCRHAVWLRWLTYVEQNWCSDSNSFDSNILIAFYFLSFVFLLFVPSFFIFFLLSLFIASQLGKFVEEINSRLHQ